MKKYAKQKWVVKKKQEQDSVWKLEDQTLDSEERKKVWKILEKAKDLAKEPKESEAVPKTERVEEVPPPPTREASDESADEKQASSSSKKEEVEVKGEAKPSAEPASRQSTFGVGVDYHDTIDPVLLRGSEQEQKLLHEQFVKAKRQTGCTFYLHSFSGKATGQGTIKVVQDWERKFASSSGEKVFSKLTFEYSVIRDKFGNNGKAAVAARRGYSALFDDDYLVLKEARAKGLFTVHVDYAGRRGGFKNIQSALKYFIEQYS